MTTKRNGQSGEAEFEVEIANNRPDGYHHHLCQRDSDAHHRRLRKEKRRRASKKIPAAYSIDKEVITK